MKFYNRTRISSSIPQRLLRERKWYLIPLYYFLLTSFLGQEATRGSGSFRLADHIYQGRPRGSFGLGKLVDAVLLSLPSAKSFRSRYVFIRDEVSGLMSALVEKNKSVHVLSVPCGIPRDLLEASSRIEQKDRIRFWGMDLDVEALEAAREIVKDHGLADSFSFVHSNAFDSRAYPRPVHIIVSTGFGEFLSDEELEQFYRVCYNALEPKGFFLTTALQRHPLSDFLLRELAEIYTYYRTREALEPILKNAGFRTARLTGDTRGLQTYVIAQKNI